MLKYEETSYFTLNEAIASLGSSVYPPAPTPSAVPAVGMFTAFSSFVQTNAAAFGAQYPGLFVTSPSFAWNGHVERLLRFLFGKYAEEYAVVVRVWGFPWDDLTQEEADRFHDGQTSIVNAMLTVIEATKDRYVNLLEGYAALESHLLDEVKVEGKAVTRFNDAPQNAGDYSGDSYTTNYNQSDTEQEIDHGTPMERLRQVQEDYANLIEEWSNRFRGMFILRSNLQ